MPRIQRVERPAHAVEADGGVLDGVVHGVAHVKDARDVGRRDDDGAVADALAALVAAGVDPLLEVSSGSLDCGS